MTNDSLAVAYAADDHYAKYLGISMLSLFRANAEFARIRVFALDCGIGEKNRTRLLKIAADAGREIAFLPIEGIREKLPIAAGELGISIASYARLFLHELLPEEIERVLYLDCDTILLAPLSELWEAALGSALVAGVQDTVDKYFLKVIDLPPGTRYLNAGVLLINLRAWREEYIGARFAAFIGRFGGRVPHHDQGTINGVCGSRRMVLPVRYNLMSNACSFPARTIRRMYLLSEYYDQAELDAAMRDPAIIHFTSGLFGRPWEEGCTHPAREAYLAFARESPWGSEPLLPSTLKRGTRAFAWAHRHMPRPLFEAAYRALSVALHLKR